MKATQFSIASVLLAAATGLPDGGNGPATPAAPVTPTKPKQFTMTVDESDKSAIMQLASEFGAPMVSAPEKIKTLTSEEILSVLYTVATDRRFKTVPVMETIGEGDDAEEIQSRDEEGNLMFETVDLIELAAAKVLALRSNSRANSAGAKLAEKDRQLADAAAELEALRKQLEALKGASA